MPAEKLVAANFADKKTDSGLRHRQPRQRLFVGQFSSVKLDLELPPVQAQVSGHPEGNAILDPVLTSQLGDDPLKVLALVVVGVSFQILGLADDLGQPLGNQGQLVSFRDADANLGHAAPLAGSVVQLQHGVRQLGQLGGEQFAVVDKAEDISISGRMGFVGVQHLFAGHRGGLPCFHLTSRLYSAGPILSRGFLKKVITFLLRFYRLFVILL